ncbi:hypothetical protein EX30DRAFT_180101 [Ascodesmis nigricans]|uniref:RanBD1 domain-containing protein n=1 Tax=Ascodesmis nigricans TaxID=341454 RepID=A0A4S2MLB1_9PEZI|nr:hypothetical protein EX30DRAFT_180101 [Ascodesmis nigricans]
MQRAPVSLRYTKKPAPKKGLAEKPMFGFQPPSANAEKPKMEGFSAKPLFGFKPPTAAPADNKEKDTESPKSIFDSPSPSAGSPSTWSNPFKPTDHSNLPDDPSTVESDNEDDSSSKPAPSIGGLFGRIGAPNTTTTTSSLFNNTNGTSTSTTSSLFSATSSAPAASNIFSSTSSTPFSFTPKASPTPDTTTTTTTTTNAAATTTTANEPSDTPPDPSLATDLSGSGPGEEDEDTLFSVKCVVYLASENNKKIGNGLARVLKNRDNGKARIIVRTNMGNVILNVRCVQGVKYVVQQGKLIVVPEFVVEGGMKRWCVRVGKEADAEKWEWCSGE